MPTKSDIVLGWISVHIPFGTGHEQAKMLKKELDGSKSVLDLGCGRGLFSLYRKYDSVGVEIYPEAAALARKGGNYKKVYRGDILDEDFPDKSFDVVTAIEVIEHLTKEDSYKLLEKMERLARKKVILTTPWGYDYLPERHDNTHLNHLCGWLPEEFKERGYRTKPIMSFRHSLRWRYGNKPMMQIAAYFMAIFGYPLVRLWPEKFCCDFVAVKDIQ